MPPVLATAEWVHWYGHHPAPFRHRHAHPRRARSRLGPRHPPPGTTTTSHHHIQLNQPPQNPGLDTVVVEDDIGGVTTQVTGLSRRLHRHHAGHAAPAPTHQTH